MKAAFSIVALLASLLFGTPDLRAQAYGPYYSPYWDFHYQQYLQYQHYLQWQQYLDYLRQTDPYYDLHVMHYQLYLRPYQPYQTYVPCCFAYGVPVAPARIAPAPLAPRNRVVQPVRRR